MIHEGLENATIPLIFACEKIDPRQTSFSCVLASIVDLIVDYILIFEARGNICPFEE